MAPRTHTLLAGEYFLGVQGMAIMRTILQDAATARPRADDTREILEHFEEFPNSLTIEMAEHAVGDGYTRWAPQYDGPNPAIATETPIVDQMLQALPRGRALDAACGTGRHAATLAALGHDVVGVDANDAMLAVARAKVPSAEFRVGRLESLPVDDASVDVAVCSLALTHVPELAPVIAELARVVRPDGSIVLSDIHPTNTLFGGIAAFPSQDITQGIPYVLNLTHHVSEYIVAFVSAALTIAQCVETLVDDTIVRSIPSFAAHPDATRQAFLGLPHLLIWRLARE
jgi:ubiquinone/menaquinone biosynthesis C-methylase UbiE